MKPIIRFSVLLFVFAGLLWGCQQTNQQKEVLYKGLIGAYYGDPDLTNIKYTEILKSFSNEWDEITGHGSSWSAQYEGYIIAPVSGEVTFNLKSNKQLVVELNSTTKVDVKDDKVGKEVAVSMEKGQKYHINLKFFYSRGDPGNFEILWKWGDNDFQVLDINSCVYDSLQAVHWNWLPEPDPATIDFSRFATPSVLEHKSVYAEEGRFAGWPANGGIWNWGDEILVNFTSGHYMEIDNHHSIDESKPAESLLCRSLDGGLTWTIEGEYKVQIKDNLEPVDFAHSNLAIKVYRNHFIVSYDKGKTWMGNYPFPDFGVEKLTSRSDYIPLSKDECMFFMSYEDKSVKARLEDKSFAAITTDGGVTFTRLGDHTPEDQYRSVMPSSVKLSENHFISALRRRYDKEFNDERPKLETNWIDVYESKDKGETWQLLSKVAETDMGKHNGNPPSLIKLNDGRLCVTYGYRAQPYGIRAKLSDDKGKTWSEEIHLQNGAREFDLGYVRSAQNADGKIVTVYYFSTPVRKHQFIEAAIWDPNTISWKQD